VIALSPAVGPELEKDRNMQCRANATDPLTSHQWERSRASREATAPPGAQLTGPALDARRFENPIAAGPGEGNQIPFDLVKRSFFETMGWDFETGMPFPQTVAALGLAAGED